MKISVPTPKGFSQQGDEVLFALSSRDEVVATMDSLEPIIGSGEGAGILIGGDKETRVPRILGYRGSGGEGLWTITLLLATIDAASQFAADLARVLHTK